MSERAPLGALLVPLLTRAMAAAPEATARALLAEVDPAAVAGALGELLEADPAWPRAKRPSARRCWRPWTAPAAR